MSILSKINKYGGIFLLKSPNTLTYSLFNYFYNKYVINLNEADEEIKDFHENGYLKPNLNFKNEAVKLMQTLDEKRSINHKSSIQFLLNEESKEIIRNILRSPKFQVLKNKIEKYFNLKLYLINVMVSRNLPLDKKIEHNTNVYSNNYHVDYYLMNYFKMFINLQDVDETQGPMNLYSKKNSKKFVTSNNYKDRSNYKLKHEKELGMIKNTGSKGDLFICSTPQCLHRASSPEIGKKRDLLFLSFAATVESDNSNQDLLSFEKNFHDDVWSNGSELRKILCKPNSARKQFFLFKKFVKNKINN